MSAVNLTSINPASASLKVAFVTVSTTDRLHMTRTLMQGVGEHHPSADRYCALVGNDATVAEALTGEFATISLLELDLPDGENLYFRYTAFELACALKPWALHFLIRKGYDVVIYLDSDIRIFGPFDEVIEGISEGSDIVITPHLLAPLQAGSQPTELQIRRSGSYNTGICAVSGRPNAEAFVKWWQGHLRYECIGDMSNGILLDQGWVELVPGLFPNVQILRHPGYNVAYWNMAQRPLTQDGDHLLADGVRLVFFHFSGFDAQQPETLSRHLHPTVAVSEAVTRLAASYLEQLKVNGEQRYRDIPYCFGAYSDGALVQDCHRIKYRTTPELRLHVTGNPFDAGVTIRAHSEPTPHLDEIYAFLLGRKPDFGAVEHYRNYPRTPADHRRLARAVAFSPEARRRPGWRIRAILWPLRRYFTTIDEGSKAQTAGG